MHRIKDSAIASSINAIILFDMKGKLMYMNRAFLEMWKYDSEDEVMMDLPARWKNREEVAEALSAIRETGSWSGEKAGSSEYTVLRKDGTTFPILSYTNPLCRVKKRWVFGQSHK